MRMWASIAERAERGYYIAVPSEKATPPLSTAIYASRSLRDL